MSTMQLTEPEYTWWHVGAVLPDLAGVQHAYTKQVKVTVQKLQSAAESAAVSTMAHPLQFVKQNSSSCHLNLVPAVALSENAKQLPLFWLLWLLLHVLCCCPRLVLCLVLHILDSVCHCAQRDILLGCPVPCAHQHHHCPRKAQQGAQTRMLLLEVGPPPDLISAGKSSSLRASPYVCCTEALSVSGGFHLHILHSRVHMLCICSVVSSGSLWLMTAYLRQMHCFRLLENVCAGTA